MLRKYKFFAVVAVTSLVLMFAQVSRAADLTSAPAGTDLQAAFDGNAWRYALVILACVFALFAFTWFIKAIAGRRRT